MCDSFGNYAAVTAFLQDVVDRRLGWVWIRVYSIPLGIIWLHALQWMMIVMLMMMVMLMMTISPPSRSLHNIV